MARFCCGILLLGLGEMVVPLQMGIPIVRASTLYEITLARPRAEWEPAFRQQMETSWMSMSVLLTIYAVAALWGAYLLLRGSSHETPTSVRAERTPAM